MQIDLTNQKAEILEAKRGLEGSRSPGGCVAPILIITAWVEVCSWRWGRRGRGGSLGL